MFFRYPRRFFLPNTRPPPPAAYPHAARPCFIARGTGTGHLSMRIAYSYHSTDKAHSSACIQ